MISRLSCSIFLLLSVVMAQPALAPGTLAPSSSTDDASSSSSDARGPITAKERIAWVVKGVVGPKGAAGEIFGAGWDTLFNSPKAYGTHWEGFGNRLGMAAAGNALSNTMEAGLGAVWGEDPRYQRDAESSFGRRLEHTFKMTFMAENRDGVTVPSYARYIAIPGSNFISNSWRVQGDNSADDAAIRTGIGFLSRWGGNTFDEFWPDVKRKLFHRNRSYP